MPYVSEIMFIQYMTTKACGLPHTIMIEKFWGAIYTDFTKVQVTGCGYTVAAAVLLKLWLE